MVCEQLKGVEIRVKANEEKVDKACEKLLQVQERCDDAERYSRRWNLRLHGVKELATEDIRKEVIKLMTLISPEDKVKMEMLVDTVHRVGMPRDNTERPVIVQFAMRYFRNKIWKIAWDSGMLKEKKIHIKEDLTHSDKMKRNKLWPIVDAARKQGKRAGFRGSDAYIDGKKVNKESLKC